MSSGDVRFDAVDPTVLRGTWSSKWRKHPADVLPLWVADMDFAPPAPVIDVLRRMVDGGFVGYLDRTLLPSLVDLFVARMARSGLVVDPARVKPVSEVVQSMHAAVTAFTAPGDGLLVLTPIYPPFLGVVEEQGRRLVEHRMTLRDGRWVFDIDLLREQARTQGARMLLLCNPHNPVGRVFTEQELRQLADVARELDLVVVSDEIHSDLVFAPHRHLPFATLDDDAAARTITVTSASKAFNLAGLRCAFMAFGSDDLWQRFRAVHAGDVLGAVSLPGVIATQAAWEHGDEWQQACRVYLQANRDHLVQRLAAELPEIATVVPEGTYLQWLDLSALDLGRPAAEALLEEARVACNEGPTFGSGLEAFARLNFATSRAVLDEAVDRLVRWSLGRGR